MALLWGGDSVAVNATLWETASLSK